MLYFRIILALLLFTSLIIFPWWVSFLLSFIGLWYFDGFYEFLILGFFIDSLYSPSDGLYKFIFLVLSLIIFILAVFVKDRIRS